MDSMKVSSVDEFISRRDELEAALLELIYEDIAFKHTPKENPPYVEKVEVQIYNELFFVAVGRMSSSDLIARIERQLYRHIPVYSKIISATIENLPINEKTGFESRITFYVSPTLTSK